VLTRTGTVLFLIAAFVLPSNSSAQDGPRLYKWTDANGVVHYGDKVPPEFANIDRDVLNTQGVQVDFQEGELTAAERAEKERRAAEQQAALQARLEIARRDRMLLATYITVSDIEDLRDRRLELLGSQIKVTELYLGNLRKRVLALEAEAGAFKPYSTREDAPQIPENLALDLSRTVALINTYEGTLARTRSDQETLRNSFDSDIERFKELKGG